MKSKRNSIPPKGGNVVVLPSWWSTELEEIDPKLRRVLSNRFTRAQLESILLAKHLAEKIHRGKTRVAGEPYVIHPFRVVLTLLIEFSQTDPELLKVALLHDVVEDSDFSASQINVRFGERVARAVAALTRTEERRKSGDRIDDPYIQGIIRGGRDCVIVKLADKLDNIRDALNHPRIDKRKLYVQEAYRVFLPLIQYLHDPPLERAIAELFTASMQNHSFFDQHEPQRYYIRLICETFDPMASGSSLRYAELEKKVHRIDVLLDNFLLFNPKLTYWLTCDGVQLVKTAVEPIKLASNVARALINRIEHRRFKSLVELTALPAFFAEPSKAHLWQRVEHELHVLLGVLDAPESSVWLSPILRSAEYLLFVIHSLLYLPARRVFPPWQNFAVELLANRRNAHQDLVDEARVVEWDHYLQMLLQNPDALWRYHIGIGSARRAQEVMSSIGRVAANNRVQLVSMRFLSEYLSVQSSKGSANVASIAEFTKSWDSLSDQAFATLPKRRSFAGHKRAISGHVSDSVDFAGFDEVETLCRDAGTLSSLEHLTALLTPRQGTATSTWISFDAPEIVKRKILFLESMKRVGAHTTYADLKRIGFDIQREHFGAETVLTVRPGKRLAVKNRLPEVTETELERLQSGDFAAVPIFDVLLCEKLRQQDQSSSIWMPRIYRILDSMADLDPFNVQSITVFFEPDAGGQQLKAYLPLPKFRRNKDSLIEQEERKKILSHYILATIISHMVILGVNSVRVDCGPITPEREDCGFTNVELQKMLIRLIRETGYQGSIRFVDNFAMTGFRIDSGSVPAEEPLFTREDMTYGTFLGIDIGGTDIKACLFQEGNAFSPLVSFPTFPEFTQRMQAEAFIDRILDEIEKHLTEEVRWEDLDGMGISWPGAMRDGRITGYSQTLGKLEFAFQGKRVALESDASAEQLQNIDFAGLFYDRALRRQPKKRRPFVVIIENDGNAEAYGNFCLLEKQGITKSRGKVVLKLGTSLAGGHITGSGAVSPYLAESSKVILDFRRSISGVPTDAAARNFVSSKGVRDLSRNFSYEGTVVFGFLPGGENSSDSLIRTRIESIELGELLDLWGAVDDEPVETNTFLDELLEADNAGGGERAAQLRKFITTAVHKYPEFTLQLHKVPRGSSRKGVEDRVAASLWRCAGRHHR